MTIPDSLIDVFANDAQGAWEELEQSGGVLTRPLTREENQAYLLGTFRALQYILGSLRGDSLPEEL